MIKIDKNTVEMTCSACPSQWEGKLEDGRWFYARYRWGYFSFRVAPKGATDVMDAVGGEEIFGKQLGDGFDGMLDTDRMLELVEQEVEPKFTIQEIANYLEAQSNYGDSVCYLSAENIREANKDEHEET